MIIVRLKPKLPIKVRLKNTVYTGEPNLQDKTVIPTTEAQTITYDTGYDGLNKVDVEAIPPEYSKVEFTDDGHLYTVVLTLPDNVTSIGQYVFYGTPIHEIIIPHSVTLIKTGAFQSSNMQKLIIPNSVLTLGPSMCNSANIENFSFEENSQPESIPEQCFSNCRTDNNIIIPSSVKAIGNYAFYQRAFTTVTEYILPDNVETIGTWAFGNNIRVTRLHLPASLQSIGTNAFYNMTSLADLTIGNGFAVSVSLSTSSNLTSQSVDNIADNIADLAGQASQTLTLHRTVYDAMTAEQKAIFTSKNWTLVRS